VGAKVTLQPVSSQGNSSNHSLTSDTDAEGKAEILTFPMKYSYHVSSDGFSPLSGRAEIRAEGGQPSELKLQIYRAVQATLRLVWEATSPQGGGKTSGDSTLNVGSGNPQANQYGQNETSWIRPIQQKDRLTLQFVDYPFGYGGPFAAAEAWVRVVPAENAAQKPEAEDSDAEQAEATPSEAKPARLEEFNALELDDIDKLKTKLPQPKLLGGGQQTGPRPPMVLAAEAGKIFVGRVQHRDHRTGQPIQLAFKVLVEELATGDEAE
jgi:hypothetical protein